MMTPKRILITGVTGFVGGYLQKALRETWPDVSVYGIGRRCNSVSDERFDSINLQSVDICQRALLAEYIGNVKPDVVIHLAALANVSASFKDPHYCWQVNLEGTRNLLDACQTAVPNAVVMIVGSADMYGAAFREGFPVTEQTALLPLNPYAASKSAADLLAWQVSQTSSLNIIRVRAFNHIGPGQSADYALSSFARQIVEIERGARPAIIETGDLNVERDLTDVRDFVQAYVALLQSALASQNDSETPAAFTSGLAVNVARGQSYNLAEQLQTLVNLADVSVTVCQHPSRIRQTDIKRVACDVTRLQQLTAWQPGYDIRQTLNDLLEGWRQRLAQS